MFHRASSRAFFPFIFAGAAVAVLSLDASAQTPPPGFTPAPGSPPPGSPATPTSAAPPGYAPPPYPYPYPPVYAPPPSRDQEAAQREALEDWEPGDPVPDGYRKVQRIRKGLVVGGSVTWGTLWLINSLVAASTHDDEGGRFDPLYIPAVGPFVTIATSRSDSLGTLALVLDGVVQTGGLAMMIAGIAAQRTTLVRDRSVATVAVVPFTPDSKTAGVGFVGSF